MKNQLIMWAMGRGRKNKTIYTKRRVNQAKKKARLKKQGEAVKKSRA